MTINQDLRSRLKTSFAPLNTVAAVKAFPPPAALASILEPLLPRNGSGVNSVPVPPQVATRFATAAVEAWMRAVHSFLISASLTNSSPIWASVIGYYSSHYSIRAFAHLLGYFQLFRKKRTVHLKMPGTKRICSFERGRKREHQFYWVKVKQDPHFATDPLFTLNNPEDEASDVGHRDRVNYADHMFRSTVFKELSTAELKKRVQFISQIEFETPPIPRPDKPGDTDSVQIVAYHRIVRFRQCLDEVLGSDNNRFWGVHRNVSWANGVIDFQLVEQGSLRTARPR